MSLLKNYFASFLKKNRYRKGISLLSYWDSATKLANNVFIAPGVRLGFCDIGEFTRIRHFATIYHCTIGKFSSIAKNARIGLGQHPTNTMSTSLIFYAKNPITNKWVRPLQFVDYKPIRIGNDVFIG